MSAIMEPRLKSASLSDEQLKYLLVNKCCVRLCFGLITVNRALQGVDHMVVRVVLIIVQYTVVCIIFRPARMEKHNVKVKLSGLINGLMHVIRRAVPGLEVSRQLQVLLPDQEICDVVQQYPEELLCTLVYLRLQHTLILHKMRHGITRDS